jgi:hypothetical protein
VGEIIRFPNKDPDVVGVPQSAEEVDKNIENVQLYHISETIDAVLPLIFNTLSASGFDLTKNNEIKNGALLVESLRSVMCQCYGIDHPLQKIAEELFRKEDDDGLLSMNESLHIDFMKTESI